jgi:hypothetical protein
MNCHALKVAYQLVQITHEESLFPILHAAGHQLVGQEDGWYTTKQQNQETEDEEFAYIYASDIWHLKLAPGQNCVDIHEATEIE